jgi:hypothetical protein
VPAKAVNPREWVLKVRGEAAALSHACECACKCPTKVDCPPGTECDRGTPHV